MADYLLELFTEEIPSRMQEGAAEYLESALKQRLREATLPFKHLETFVTPRRLGVHIKGLPTLQEDQTEEKKGPRVDAPEKAIEGFLKSTGLTLDACEKREIGSKTFYFATLTKKGRPLKDILTEIIPAILKDLPWPKSMRWGSYQMTWVRPLGSVISLLDGEVLPFPIEDPHVIVSHTTQGHRFLSGKTLTVDSFDSYAATLLEHKVVIQREKRMTMIQEQLQALASKHKVVVKEDLGLLKEVAGLVEWPVALMGRIDNRFMDLPPEVLETTMRSHQKYFSVLHQDGSTAPFFVTISNMETSDNGAKIIEGNERVLRARLSDAAFFWEQDQNKPLETWRQDLSTLIFHKEVGSVLKKTDRMKALAHALCPTAEAEKAAQLSKADLVTGMVGEFSELQGIMGSYYAQRQKHPLEVAQAIRDHYAPLGPSDQVPNTPTSIAVALADKLDTLVAFWSIGIKPTGSKDPYALRRCTLGIIRIIFENGLDLPLKNLLEKAYDLLPQTIEKGEKAEVISSLLSFIKDRLKVFFKGQGLAHMAAALPQNWDGNIQKTHAVTVALDTLLKTPVGQDLLTAYKRAANSVYQAEKAGETLKKSVDLTLLSQAEEKELYQALTSLEGDLQGHLKESRYDACMESLATLKKPLDHFFEQVTVQAEEEKIRHNRLNLLFFVRYLMNSIADFGAL